MSDDPYLLSDAPSHNEEFTWGNFDAPSLDFGALDEFEGSLGTNQAVEASFDELFDRLAGDADSQAILQALEK